jgi:hypothetical protein
MKTIPSGKGCGTVAEFAIVASKFGCAFGVSELVFFTVPLFAGPAAGEGSRRSHQPRPPTNVRAITTNKTRRGLSAVRVNFEAGVVLCSTRDFFCSLFDLAMVDM